MGINKFSKAVAVAGALAFLAVFMLAGAAWASSGEGGEILYKKLCKVAGGNDDPACFETVNQASSDLDWSGAKKLVFDGNMRILKLEQSPVGGGADRVYLLKDVAGPTFILALPADKTDLTPDSGSPYAALSDMLGQKMAYQVEAVSADLFGRQYSFARLVAKPQTLALDQAFRISVVVMLFFIMLGMGMTLTVADFAQVFKKPKGMFLGQILQFGLLPLLAMGISYLFGFHQQFPFIYVGMILISSSPGGVTSNLMTHYAKGDLALSISLTSVSTVMSIIFTPLLLAAYCSGMPDVDIPVDIVVKSILVMVIIPLALGMSVKSKWPNFAAKTVPFSSALGMFALIALIVAAIANNPHAIMDTARYGVKFYSAVFMLTLLGMIFGAVCSKMIGINNYQTRAISLETGLRNSALAMTIAILIQDRMGDFYSSMLFTSGMFGLIMFLAGAISIVSFKSLLPLDVDEAPADGTQIAKQ